MDSPRDAAEEERPASGSDGAVVGALQQLREGQCAGDAQRPLEAPASSPGASCCERCGQRLASEVAGAARGAVEAAFSELQAALHLTVSRAVVDLLEQRASNEAASEPAAGPGAVLTRPVSYDQVPEDRAMSGEDSEERLLFAGRLTGLSARSALTDVSRQSKQTSSSRQTSQASPLSPSTTIYSLGRPTVQSLQADVALAVLEHSSLGQFVRRTHSSSSQNGGLRSGRVRGIVPESEHTQDGESSVLDRRDRSTSLNTPSYADDLSRDEFSETSRRRGTSRTVSRISRTSSRNLTGGQVLQARIDELAQEASPMQGSMSGISEVSVSKFLVAAPVPIALRAVGILSWDVRGSPWASMAFEGAARALVALAVTAFFLAFVASPDGFARALCGADCGAQTSLLSEVALPVGAALVLCPFGLRRHQRRLEETFWLVRGVSLERHYEDWETRRHRWDAATFVLIWLLSVAAAVLSHRLRDVEAPPSHSALHVGLTALFSAVILCLAHGMARICRSLIVMVDTFCCDVVGTMQLQKVAHVWNMTQAVLRKASADVESSLLVLCVIIAFSVPLLAIDVAVSGLRSQDIPMLLPGFCVTCGIMYSLVLAAMVSDKSTRVPALINAVSFGPGTEQARQQTVDYVTSSAAGFYVFDMRLTTERVVKFMYVWCLVVMGVLTRLASAR